MQIVDFWQALVSQTVSFPFFKLFIAGLIIFVLAYFAISRLLKLTKIALCAFFGLIIYAYYDLIPGLYYPILLGIYFFVMLGAMSLSSFLAELQNYILDESLALKKLIRNVRIFYALSFVFAYLGGINLLFYPLTDGIFTYFMPMFGLLIIALIGDLFDLEKIYQKLQDFVSSTKKGQFFTLEKIYKELDLYGKRAKFKAFAQEIIQGLEYQGKLVSVNLYGENFYFEQKHLQKLITKTEAIFKEYPKMSLKDGANEISKIISLQPFLQTYKIL